MRNLQKKNAALLGAGRPPKQKDRLPAVFRTSFANVDQAAAKVVVLFFARR